MSAPAKEFSDADSTAAHIQRVATLAESLKKVGAAIYEHHWDCLCFGSWTITAGRRKDCFEFSWDGREFFLALAHSHDISGSPQTWHPVENHRFAPASGRDPLAFIDEFFRKKG